MTSRILCLDFDGVLHPGATLINANFREGMPIVQIVVAMLAQKRFVWAPVLEDLLAADDQVGILIHSTWRRRFSDRDLREFLPPGLQSRLISMDGSISPADRKELSADEYVALGLEILQPSSALVIDDKMWQFSDGGQSDRRVLQWGGVPGHHLQLVTTDIDRGISDPRIKDLVSRWVADGSHHANVEDELAKPSHF